MEHDIELRKMLRHNTEAVERLAHGLVDSLRAADAVMHVTEPFAAAAGNGNVCAGSLAASVGSATQEGFQFADALDEILEKCSSLSYERGQLCRYDERLRGLEQVAMQAAEMLEDLLCRTGVKLEDRSRPRDSKASF